MSTPFTNGPWTCNPNFRANDGAFAVIQKDGDKHIGFVTFQGKAKRGQAWCTPDSEGEANAHLIAAAPDMYAALKELLRVDEDWHGAVNSEMSGARMNAREALAKAVPNAE